MKRRTFLKTIGAGTGSLALSAVAPPSVAGANTPGAAGAGEPLATLLDISKCIACGACVEACREANAHKFPEPVNPIPDMLPRRVKKEDWSDRRDVDDRLTPYNWLYIQTAEVQWQGETVEVNVPRRCLHCTNPPCANLCPWGAARKEKNGIVRIDSDICLGGAKCRAVCPWSIPQRQSGVGLYLDLMPSLAGNGVMYKCDRCHDRIARGELPACIEACPMDVQTIGPRSEIVAAARELAREKGLYIYGLDENGGTNTVYVSPVPFEVLDRAVETGPGRPHLGEVEDSMADQTKLAAAVAVAPLAGLAAGLVAMRGKKRPNGAAAGPGEGEDES